jgi:hypothetical protein
MILGIRFPVVHLNLRETGDKKFKLLFVEDGNQLRRNDLVEAYKDNEYLQS